MKIYLITQAELKKKNFGYTLIEILVVLVIISIVTTVALLQIGHNKNKELNHFTTNLRETLALAEEQAMLQPATFGLIFSENHFDFRMYQTQKNKLSSAWVALNDTLLGRHFIPPNIQIQLKVAGQRIEQKTATPPIIISPSGNITPFTLWVGKKGEAPRVILTGEADGSLTQKML